MPATIGTLFTVIITMLMAISLSFTFLWGFGDECTTTQTGWYGSLTAKTCRPDQCTIPLLAETMTACKEPPTTMPSQGSGNVTAQPPTNTTARNPYGR